mmetsp:Transcript_57313/g.129848  ORF Transcript_57313/g.129848 Transcript_57313/m.129848 type:complete len:376 (-) Transcript_57313:197-1324(-)
MGLPVLAVLGFDHAASGDGAGPHGGRAWLLRPRLRLLPLCRPGHRRHREASVCRRLPGLRAFGCAARPLGRGGGELPLLARGDHLGPHPLPSRRTLRHEAIPPEADHLGEFLAGVRAALAPCPSARALARSALARPRAQRGPARPLARRSPLGGQVYLEAFVCGGRGGHAGGFRALLGPARLRVRHARSALGHAAQTEGLQNGVASGLSLPPPSRRGVRTLFRLRRLLPVDVAKVGDLRCVDALGAGPRRLALGPALPQRKLRADHDGGNTRGGVGDGERFGGPRGEVAADRPRPQVHAQRMAQGPHVEPSGPQRGCLGARRGGPRRRHLVWQRRWPRAARRLPPIKGRGPRRRRKPHDRLRSVLGCVFWDRTRR